jgi:hypothetical protein
VNVFYYWANEKPAWIDVCLKSIERNCTDGTKFHLLTPESIEEGDTGADDIARNALPERWLELPPGVGTDCLRAILLYELGGCWIDADTVCITNPANLIKNRHNPSQFLYSRWPSQPDRVIAGYVYSPQGHLIARQWSQIVRSALLNAETIGWGELGEKTLTPMVNRSASAKSSWQIPLETFMPVDIDTNVQRYFERSGWLDFATQNTIAFGLNYSWMMDKKGLDMERLSSIVVGNSKVYTVDTMVGRLIMDAHYLNQCHERGVSRAK